MTEMACLYGILRRRPPLFTAETRRVTPLLSLSSAALKLDARLIYGTAGVSDELNASLGLENLESFQENNRVQAS